MKFNNQDIKKFMKYQVKKDRPDLKGHPDFDTEVNKRMEGAKALRDDIVIYDEQYLKDRPYSYMLTLHIEYSHTDNDPEHCDVQHAEAEHLLMRFKSKDSSHIEEEIRRVIDLYLRKRCLYRDDPQYFDIEEISKEECEKHGEIAAIVANRDTWEKHGFSESHEVILSEMKELWDIEYFVLNKHFPSFTSIFTNNEL